MNKYRDNYEQMRIEWNKLLGSTLLDEYREYTCYCTVRESVFKLNYIYYCRKCGYPLPKNARQ